MTLKEYFCNKILFVSYESAAFVFEFEQVSILLLLAIIINIKQELILTRKTGPFRIALWDIGFEIP